MTIGNGRGYDADGHLDDEAARLFDHGTTSVTRGTTDDKFPFSKIVANHEAATRKLYGFIRGGNITEPKEDLLLNRQLQLFEVFWNARACNRQGHYDHQEEQAKHWRSQIAPGYDDHDEAPEQLGNVEKLLQQWSESNAFQQQVRILHARHGLNHVEEYRARWAECSEAKEDAEFAAGNLTPAAYRYFLCRLQQYQNLDDRAMAQALGLQEVDFTEVKARLAAGAEVDNEVSNLPWIYQYAFTRVQRSMDDGEKHYEVLMSLHSQTLPYHLQPPRPGKKGFLGIGGRNDRPDDEEDEAPAQPSKRGGRRN